MKCNDCGAEVLCLYDGGVCIDCYSVAYVPKRRKQKKEIERWRIEKQKKVRDLKRRRLSVKERKGEIK